MRQRQIQTQRTDTKTETETKQRKRKKREEKKLQEKTSSRRLICIHYIYTVQFDRDLKSTRDGHLNDIYVLLKSLLLAFFFTFGIDHGYMRRVKGWECLEGSGWLFRGILYIYKVYID